MHYHQVQELSQVLPAFSDPNALNSINASQVTQFANGGGSAAQGEIQPALKEVTLFNVTESGVAKFQYFVDVKEDATPTFAHCSDIRLHVNIDGRYVGVTQWLGYEGRPLPLPLDTGIISVNGITPGKHFLVLVPQGRVGGCNSGYLYSWGGVMVIFK